MALSSSPRPVLDTVASTESHTAGRIRETLAEAEALERAGTEALGTAHAHLEGFRSLERALTMRLRAAQLAEAAELAASPTAKRPEPSQFDAAAVRRLCTQAAERTVVLYNEAAVRTFKRGDFEHASHLLSNAFRLCELTDEADVIGDTSLRHRLKATTLNNFGCLERRRGRLAVALQYMRHSLDFASSQSPATLLNMAAVLTQMGNVDEAIGAARRAVGLLESVDPTGARESVFGGNTLPLRAVAHHNLAMALERRDVREAVEEYRTALRLAHDAGAAQTAAQVERGLARASALVTAAESADSPRKTRASDVAADDATAGDPDIDSDAALELQVQQEALAAMQALPDVRYDLSKKPAIPPHPPVQPKARVARDAQPGHTEERVAQSASSVPKLPPVAPAASLNARAATGPSAPKSTESAGPSAPTSSAQPTAKAPKPPAEPRDGPGRSLRPEPSATQLDSASAAKAAPQPPGEAKSDEARAATDAQDGKPAASESPRTGGSELATSSAEASRKDRQEQPSAPAQDTRDQQRAASGRDEPPGYSVNTSMSSPAARATASSPRRGGPAPPTSTPGAGTGRGLRTKEEEEMTKDEAVTFLYHRLVALLKLEDEHEARYIAARKIQCAVRKQQARAERTRRRRERQKAAKGRLVCETTAARTVVAFFRMLKARRQAREAAQATLRRENERRVAATVRIQSAARKFLARRFVRRLRRLEALRDTAARVVQRSTRCFLARVRLHRMKATRDEATRDFLQQERERVAACKIQAAYRRHFTAIRLLLERGDVKAARERGWMLGRSLAATRIQRLWRGYAVRKRHGPALRDRNIRRRNREKAARRLAATVAIQAAGRGWKLRQSLRKPYRAHLAAMVGVRAASRHLAAVRIQCLVRCAFARSQLRQRRAARHRELQEERLGAVHVSVRGYQHSLEL